MKTCSAEDSRSSDSDGKGGGAQTKGEVEGAGQGGVAHLAALLHPLL